MIECTECGRIFDASNKDDANEYFYGHDCEPMMGDIGGKRMMAYYYHDHETGMEHWHDGVDHSEHCHDGVGLITRTWQSLDDFLTDYPNADYLSEG